MIKITSKEKAINKTKWLRGKINEWAKKIQGKEYLIVNPNEKGEVIETLKALENFVFQK